MKKNIEIKKIVIKKGYYFIVYRCYKNYIIEGPYTSKYSAEQKLVEKWKLKCGCCCTDPVWRPKDDNFAWETIDGHEIMFYSASIKRASSSTFF